MSSDRHKTLLVVCFAAATYRIFWAFAITTLFVPDEYYQTVEPSKKIFDGTFESGLNSTWEWRDEYRIRSFVPLLPYLLLHHLKFFGKIFPTFFSSEILALKGPRLMNSLISSCSDLAFFFILEKFTKSSGIAFFVLCVHLFSWSASYCLSRTLANSTETALIIIGLFFWLSEHHSGFGLLDYPLISSVQSSKKLPASLDNFQCKIAASETRTLRGVEGLRSRKPATETSKETDSAIIPEPSKKAEYPLSLAVALITITVHCRPTAVLFWAPLIGLRILQKRNPLKYIAFHCIPTGLITFLSCIAIDSFFYKDLAVTPFNFFYINITRNYAELYYGAKPWHWNFSNGFPVMLGLYTPTLIYSCIYTMQPVDAIVLELISVLYAVLLRCVTAHQEFRFLLPCVAFFHVAVGFTLWNATVWCIPRLGKPYMGTSTLLSFCLSGLSTSILTNIPLHRHGADAAAVNPRAEDVLLDYDQSPINDSSSISSKKKKMEKKEESNRTPEDCHDGNIERESGSAGSRVHVGMRAVGILALSSVFIAHIGTAYYLSTRHQVRTQ